MYIYIYIFNEQQLQNATSQREEKRRISGNNSVLLENLDFGSENSVKTYRLFDFEETEIQRMKKSGVFMASMAAASATAISASPSSSSPNFFGNSKMQASSQQEVGLNEDRENSSTRKLTASTEKFAPRFDGLRFIETLVTAHR